MNVSAATATTLIQLATPSTRCAKIIEVTIYFKSVTSTDVPGVIQLVRQNAGTASALTPLPRNEFFPAALCSVNQTFTVEPGTNTVLWTHGLPPQGGNMIFQTPLGNEHLIKPSSFLGLRVTFPQAQVCRAMLAFEE